MVSNEGISFQGTLISNPLKRKHGAQFGNNNKEDSDIRGLINTILWYYGCKILMCISHSVLEYQ